MKNVLSSKQRSEDLKRLAYECAERKYNGCNDNCSKCPLNISLYLEDQREAVLIQTNAELDYQNNVQYYNEQVQQQIKQQKEENVGNIAKIIGYFLGVFLIFILPILMIQSCIKGCSVSMNIENKSQTQLAYNNDQFKTLIVKELNAEVFNE